ncbi:MAG: tyrosine-type recombinase/integrase [Sedimentisphaerales bacterium]|nr:tyrosine-type recombinase/integrase [Sedimentisphaerales bacterium]
MLQHDITTFLDYCRDADFSQRSVESLAFRLHEFNQFVQIHAVSSVNDITYPLLAQFVADFHKPSVHVKKARVWCLHQFFHYLKLHQLIQDNIALKLPYPKIEKKLPAFLTQKELNQILKHFAQQATTATGLRNLVIISLLGFLGLRTATIANLNITDIDLAESRIWIKEKGAHRQSKKDLPLPQILCRLLAEYIRQLNRQHGPLFMSKRQQRLARRSLQSIFYQVAQMLGIDKKLHPHLFRHTAATQLNQVAGMEITQFVLGHQSQHYTHQYAHLNPDIYAEHMRNHPYMKLDL